MADDSKSSKASRPVQSYKIVKSSGKTEVTVTSGTFAGKSARIISTTPAAAYFNSSPGERTSNS